MPMQRKQPPKLGAEGRRVFGDPESFIDELDEVEYLCAKELAEEINEMIELLSPDGRPFGMEPESPEVARAKYEALVADPEGWLKWMQERYDRFRKDTQGIPPERFLAVGLTDEVLRSIVVAYALNFRERMESMLAESQAPEPPLTSPVA